MNFFESQDLARRKTRFLILMFMLAVLAIVASVNLVITTLIFNSTEEATGTIPDLTWLVNNQALLVSISLVTIALISLSSLYKIVSLSSGGGKVARSLGGTLITAETKDPLRRRLYNVVEEMAIASSIPMPEVYVLEHESGINAFAAGFSGSDAAITVTRGALEMLSRDELQGVIGHEFSHILNGDMRLNMRLMGFLFGILFIGLIGRTVLNSARYSTFRSSSSRKSDGIAAVYIAGLALFLIGYIGVFFGQLIKAAVSRQREFLADASAVQFTRQTQGIVGALKKIAAGRGSEFKSVDTDEVSHMLFATGSSFNSLLATHPPLIQRIKALEPNFSESEIGQMTEQLQETTDFTEESITSGGFTPQQINISSKNLTETIGMPDETHVQLASSLRQSIPENLYHAAHSSQDALPLVSALLLDANESVRGVQNDLISKQLGIQTLKTATSFQLELQNLGVAFRLPLLQIAFPMIKNRPIDQLERLQDLIQQLVEADGSVDTFEFALGRVLKTHLHDATHPQHRHGKHRLTQFPEAIGILFSVLAKQGHTDTDIAKSAYQKGMEALGRHQQRIQMLIRCQQWPDYQPLDEWVQSTDVALNQLDELDVLEKQALVTALVLTISFDGKVSSREAELLRAVCAALHCPLPPFVFDQCLSV